MTTEKRNDEIDLIEVFQKMGNGLKNLLQRLFNLFYSILLFFVRKAVLIFIVCVIALSLGFLNYKTSDRYYSSTLEAYSNAMSSLDMIKYVNNIHELFKEDNKEALLSKLWLNNKILERIKDAKAYKVIDLNSDGIIDLIDFKEEYKSSDTSVSKTRFAIKVEVYDRDALPLIQESILNYINENKYIKDLNVVRKRQVTELITKLDYEVLMLDSLKKSEYFSKEEDRMNTQRGQLLVMNEKTTQLYHDQIINLYKEKQGLEEILELRTEPITIVQDFSAFSTIENKLSSYLKRFGIMGLVLGTFLALVFENYKGIRKVVGDSKRK